MDADLQSRFEAALRRALAGATEAAPSVQVDVAAPNVSVSPRVEVAMPSGPVLIENIHAGQFGLKLTVTKRTAEGSIDEALIEPVTFFPLGSFDK